MAAQDNFRAQRKELGLTQQDVAVLLGISRVTYIKYEQEPDLMPLGQYKKLVTELERFRNLKEDAHGVE